MTSESSGSKKYAQAGWVWLGLVVSKFHLSSWSEAERTCLRPARSISTCRDRAILLEARFSTRKNCELVGNLSNVYPA